MKLEDLKVQSFVTRLEDQKNSKLGGSGMMKCISGLCQSGVEETCPPFSVFLGCEEEEGPGDEVSILKPIGGGDQQIATQFGGGVLC